MLLDGAYKNIAYIYVHVICVKGILVLMRIYPAVIELYCKNVFVYCLEHYHLIFRNIFITFKTI